MTIHTGIRIAIHRPVIRILILQVPILIPVHRRRTVDPVGVRTKYLSMQIPTFRNIIRQILREYNQDSSGVSWASGTLTQALLVTQAKTGEEISLQAGTKVLIRRQWQHGVFWLLVPKTKMAYHVELEHNQDLFQFSKLRTQGMKDVTLYYGDDPISIEATKNYTNWFNHQD